MMEKCNLDKDKECDKGIEKCRDRESEREKKINNEQRSKCHLLWTNDLNRGFDLVMMYVLAIYVDK